MKVKKTLLLILAIGLFFRLWGINFGLPYYFHNDESEIVEPVLNAAFNSKEILLGGNIDLLRPHSFVYGTAINYTLIPFITGIKKVVSLLEFNPATADYYLITRIVLSIITTLSILYGYKAAESIFKNKKIGLIAATLIALNWKIIVFSHFVNSDIFLTLTVLGFYYYFLKYLDQKKSMFIIASGIFLGLSIGTKITAAISLPVVIYMLFKDKDFGGFIKFTIATIAAFIISNPFSILDFNGYSGRVISMFTKEAGTVLSSANDSIFRYIASVNFLSTTLIFLVALLAYKVTFKENKKENIFLGLNVLMYLLFFTLGSDRRTDRWMLPILPIILIYASYGMYKILNFKKGLLTRLLVIIICILYIRYPITLLFQFRQEIPKYNSFVWAKENITEKDPTLVITETGYSPFNEMPNANVFNLNMYESKNGNEQKPPNPFDYKYVITASKPMDVHKNKYIKKNYPEYYNNWSSFEENLNNTKYFNLIEEFNLKGKNIITLSEMKIYKRSNEIPGCFIN